MLPKGNEIEYLRSASSIKGNQKKNERNLQNLTWGRKLLIEVMVLQSKLVIKCDWSNDIAAKTDSNIINGNHNEEKKQVVKVTSYMVQPTNVDKCSYTFSANTQEKVGTGNFCSWYR